tara:strand:+ start:439 stop:996 length:558 start_codon:yes stop_codon:yes gene_type:complete
MAQEDIDLYENNRFSFQRPVPGQSLTNDPANPLPFEGSPEYTDIDDAIHYFFSLIVDEDHYPQIVTALRFKFPIMDLTEVLLFNAFVEGKINPDLMLLLAEPVAYMLLYITDVEMFDPVIVRPEEDDTLTDEERDGVPDEFDLNLAMEQAGTADLDKEPSEVLDPEIISKLKQATSLLAAPQENT